MVVAVADGARLPEVQWRRDQRPLDRDAASRKRPFAQSLAGRIRTLAHELVPLDANSLIFADGTGPSALPVRVEEECQSSDPRIRPNRCLERPPFQAWAQLRRRRTAIDTRLPQTCPGRIALRLSVAEADCVDVGDASACKWKRHARRGRPGRERKSRLLASDYGRREP